MRRGVAEAVVAYVIWGLSPIFWKQLDSVPAAQTVGHRIVWTFLTLAVVHTLRRSWGELRRAGGRRHLAVLTAALIAANWATFVWAVQAERVVEASLGYFVGPLVSVFCGVLVLGERMRRGQWVAVAVAAVGVAWLTVQVGSLPWVSLVLAFTFALYGLLRKTASYGSLEGLTYEMIVLLGPAIAFLALTAGDDWSMGVSRPGVSIGLVLTGAVTAAPLLLFAAAARRELLATVGMLQYLTPILQFLVGVVLYGESVGGDRLVGYAIVWMGVVVFATEGWMSQRRVVPTHSKVVARRE